MTNQTRKYLRTKIRKIRRLRQIAQSICRHRKAYLKGVTHIGKSIWHHARF